MNKPKINPAFLLKTHSKVLLVGAGGGWTKFE